jgi:hypothetical protein
VSWHGDCIILDVINKIGTVMKNKQIPVFKISLEEVLRNSPIYPKVKNPIQQIINEPFRTKAVKKSK